MPRPAGLAPHPKATAANKGGMVAHVEKYNATQLGQMSEHWLRSREPQGHYGNEKIDPRRSGLNYDLTGQDPQTGIWKRANLAMLDADVRVQRRKDVNVCADWVVTLPKDWPAERDSREFFEACDGFLRGRYERFGQDGRSKGNVLAACVHRDETRDHMHWSFLPLAPDENPKHAEHWKVSAKDVLTRQDLKSFHADLQRHVERELGIKLEILLGEERKTDRALSHVPQRELDAARKAIEAPALQYAEHAKAKAMEAEMQVREAEARIAEITSDQARLMENSRRMKAEVEAYRSKLPAFEKTADGGYERGQVDAWAARRERELEGMTSTVEGLRDDVARQSARAEKAEGRLRRLAEKVASKVAGFARQLARVPGLPAPALAVARAMAGWAEGMARAFSVVIREASRDSDGRGRDA